MTTNIPLNIQVDTNPVTTLNKEIARLREQLGKIQAAAGQGAQSTEALAGAQRGSVNASTQMINAFNRLHQAQRRQQAQTDRTTTSTAKSTTAQDKQATAVNNTASAYNRLAIAANRALAPLRRMQMTAMRVGNSMKEAASGANLLVTGLTAYAGHRVITSLMDTAVAVQQINMTLTAVTGSSEDAAEQFDYVTRTADRLGQSVRGAARGYSRLLAAAEPTNLTIKETQTLFEGVTAAATVYGLTQDEVNGALNALQQIISKGSVQAEELRGQLGERLPGAYQIAARSLGLTTQELSKALEQGQVDAETFVRAFGQHMHDAFVTQAEGAQTASRQINELENAWFALKKIVVDSGFDRALATVFTAIATFLQTDAVVMAAKALGNAFLFVADSIDLFAIAATAALFLVAGPAGWIAGILTLGARLLGFGRLLSRQIPLITNYGRTTVSVLDVIQAAWETTIHFLVRGWRWFADGIDEINATIETAFNDVADHLREVMQAIFQTIATFARDTANALGPIMTDEAQQNLIDLAIALEGAFEPAANASTGALAGKKAGESFVDGIISELDEFANDNAFFNELNRRLINNLAVHPAEDMFGGITGGGDGDGGPPTKFKPGGSGAASKAQRLARDTLRFQQAVNDNLQENERTTRRIADLETYMQTLRSDGWEVAQDLLETQRKNQELEAASAEALRMVTDWNNKILDARRQGVKVAHEMKLLGDEEVDQLQRKLEMETRLNEQRREIEEAQRRQGGKITQNRLEGISQAVEDIKVLQEAGVINSALEEFLILDKAVADATGLETFEQGLSNLFGTFTDGIEAAITGTQTWGETFEAIGRQMIKMMVQLIAKQIILAAFGGGGGMFGGLFGGAGTNAIGGGTFGIAGHSRGGIVNSPTVVGMSGRNVAVAGEMYREEAVLPLARTSSGDMGVQVVSMPAPANVPQPIAAGGGGGGGGGNTMVSVIVNGNANVREEREQRGDDELITLIVDTVSSQVTRGGNAISDSLETTYAGVVRSGGGVI